MIARILGDRRYVGTDVYPQILLCEEFEAAESIRSSKIQTDMRSDAQRLLYKLSDKRPAAQTEADVLVIINALIHDPSLIKEQKTVPDATETLELQQEFDDLLLVQPIDEIRAKQLIFQMAAAQYAAIDARLHHASRGHKLLRCRRHGRRFHNGRGVQGRRAVHHSAYCDGGHPRRLPGRGAVAAESPRLSAGRA